MAGDRDRADLDKPAFGVFPHMRPTRSNQDREAAKNVPVDLVRGALSGALGIPGDLESLIRLFPGLDEKTILPTSEEIEKRIPFGSDTPVSRAATGLGQLAGGFYTGPGAPIRALTGLPGALAHGAGEFAKAAGASGSHVIKQKGGNWLERGAEGWLSRFHRGDAVDNWINTNLTNYVKKQMATPEDPVRELAERGITHARMPTYEIAPEELRRMGGFPPEGLGQSQQAKEWEAASDFLMNPVYADRVQLANKQGREMTAAMDEELKKIKEITQRYREMLSGDKNLSREDISLRILQTRPEVMAKELGMHDELTLIKDKYRRAMSGFEPEMARIAEDNPWIEKVEPSSLLHRLARTQETLGFDHIIDVMREDIASGRLNPESLPKVSMKQAVERTYQYDQEMAKKARAAQIASREGLPVYKEYPEGYRWIELNRPGSFATESDAMGHSVRGYEPPAGHPDWIPESGKSGYPEYGHGGWEAIKSGKAKIYSLVDPRGEPHVTVETSSFVPDEAPRITQIKGKSNRKPEESHIPFVQDFVRSGDWSGIGDLKNSGLIDVKSLSASSPEYLQKAVDDIGNRYVTLPELNEWLTKENKPGGMAKGGSVGISDNPDVQMSEVMNPLFMDEGGAAFGQYTTGKKYQGARQRAQEADVNLLKDPKTYAVLSSLMGTAPDEAGFSLMHPEYESILAAADPAFWAGTALGIAPAGKLLTTGAKALAGQLAPKAGQMLENYMLRQGLAIPIVDRGAPSSGVELSGALKPSKAPVRGQTSKELQGAQKQQLTDEQKELFERLRQSNPSFAEASKFMTPQEVVKIISSPAGVKQIENLLNILPSAKELASVAKAGSPKLGWYRASTQAIIDVFGLEDAPRFASLLASLSPQTSVEMNLLNSLNTWKNWNAAGRPTNADEIRRVLGQSVSGTKGDQSVLEAWTNNAIRSLSSPDPTKVTLSGPKVDSFFRNLADDVYRVTNDAWMASGLGVGQELFSGSPTAIQIAKGDPGLTPGYIGTSARMRQAGQMAGMLPSEAQETTWSLFMPLYETARSQGIPAREVLQRGLLTPDVIRGTPDFASLLTQGKYGDILRNAGYEEQLSKLQPTPFSRTSPELSLSEQRDLERAARRLEDLKELRGAESRSRSISLPSDENLQKAFAYGTYETIPGRGVGHLESLIDEPFGTRQHFSSKLASVFKDPQGRDVLQDSLGLNPISTRGMTGAYRAEGEMPYQGTLRYPSTGRHPLETNPGFATGVEVPVTKSGDIPVRFQKKLTAAEAARGYMTAQRGSPWNAQIPTKGGESMFVSLEKKADPERIGMLSSLADNSASFADTGAGTAVLNWAKPMTQAERDYIEMALGGRGVQTKNVSNYVDFGKEFESGYGSGEATRKLLGIVGELPQSDQRALSEAMKKPSGELADIYEKASQTRKEPIREDLVRGLKIIQKAGLPGLAAALAAGEALAEEKPTPPLAR